jgi:hypothetical protein
MRLHEHYVCEHDYAGIEIVDTRWCLLLTAYASHMGEYVVRVGRCFSITSVR